MPVIEIGDHNYHQFINPVVDGEVKACAAYGVFEPGFSSPAMVEFEDQETIPLIPESEWDDRIEQDEQDGTTIEQFCNDMDLECLDQNGTNYCWANGVAMAAMITRMQETGREIRYSPASVAWPIKRGNRGGWGTQALEFMVQNGINLASDYPPNELSGRSYTDANKGLAERHRVVEFVRTKNWEQLGSMVLAKHPVGVGYNWWSHLVCAVGLRKGDHALRILNSWKPAWGENGFGWLTDRKKVPDGEAAGILSMRPI